MADVTMGTVTAKVMADTSDYDAKIKKSTDLTTASARDRVKAAKMAADAEAFAAKFAGDTVTAQALRIVAARKTEAQATADLRQAQKLAKVEYEGEEKSANLVALALQRLTLAREAVAAATKVETAASESATSQTIAASAAVRSLEGNPGIRSIERFITTIPGVGKALQGIFPFIGAAGLAGLVVSLGEKFYEMESKALHAAETTREAFAEVHDKAQVNIDDLTLTSDKLQGEIDKLSKNPGNGLQIGLDEARKYADALLVTLRADNKELASIFKENSVSLVDSVFTGVEGTGRQSDEILKDQKKLIEDIRAINTESIRAQSEASDPAVQKQIEQKSNKAIHDRITAEIANYKKEQTRLAKEQSDAEMEVVSGVRGAQSVDNSAKIANVQGYISQLQERDAVLSLDSTIAARTTTAASLKSGDVNVNKADQLRLKALEAQLAAMELDRPISDKAKFDFWGQHIAEFQSGSEAFQQVLEKQAALAVSGAAKAHELITRGMKGISDTANLSPAEADRGIAEFNAMLREQAEDVSRTGERWKAYNAEVAKGAETMAAAAFKIREVMIAHEVATGAISKYDAAVLTTSAHSQEFAAKLDALKAELEGLKQDQANLDPSGKDYEREMPQLVARQQAVQNQIDATQAQADQQAQQDAWQQFSETGLGGAVAALQEFTAASKDSAAQLKQLTSSTLDSFNKTLLSIMTTPGRDHQHAWTNLGKSVFTDISSTALKKGEGSLMSAFGIPGLGGGKLGTKSNPMFVKIADAVPKLPGMGAAPAMPNIPGFDLSGTDQFGAAAGGSSSAAQTMFGVGAKVAMAAIPFLADGGPFSPGFAVVGEQGPELVHFGGSGHVTPNHKLSSLGGGETHHHWNIDARGSSNPAETMALVQRGIMQAAPHLIAASVKAGRNDNMRTAPTMRRS